MNDVEPRVNRNRARLTRFGLLPVLDYRNLPSVCYEKREKKQIGQYRDRPRMLLVRHSVTKSEMSGLLCRVIVVKAELHMLSSVVTNSPR